MRRLLAVSTLALLATAVMVIGGGASVMAAPDIVSGTETNPGECDGNGKLVISVTHSVVNDGDSGIGGYWAYDTYERSIQVWQTGTTTFCALTRYKGSFTSIAGTSPGATETIAAGIEGTFEGGYRATIDGTLQAAPALPTRGRIGSFDYRWDGHSAHGAHTPFSWVGTYFEPSPTFTYQWWGWIYRAGTNGVWVNSSDGNTGDITD